MTTHQRMPSVKECKTFYEQLSLPLGITVRAVSTESNSKPRPISDICRLSAPQKPKRTFEHELSLEMDLLSVGTPPTPPSAMAKLLAAAQFNETDEADDPEDCSSSSGSKTINPRCGSTEPSYYAVTPVAMRRRHSDNDLYAVPISEQERIRRNAEAKHHNVLYYASANVKPNEKEKEAHMSTLRRKFAFKKNTKSGRAEISPSKLHSTRNVDSDLQRRATRAKLVRRGTLAHNDHLEEFRGRPKPQLFEAALLVKIYDHFDVAKNAIVKEPRIDFCFPSECENSLNGMAELFYPDYSHTSPYIKGDYWAGDEEFMVALTQSDGSRRYAYCLKFLPMTPNIPSTDAENNSVATTNSYPLVLAIITPIRNSIFYMDLVRSSHQYARTGAHMLREFMNSVFPHQYPNRKGASLFILEKLPIGLTRRIQIKNHGSVMGRTGSAAMINRLTPEVTVCLVAALLGEQRVLIAGNSVGDVDIVHPACRMQDHGKLITCSTTRIVQMLEALIRPLPWPHTFIPIVPDNLIDLCDNPTPYLMGILRSNLSLVKELIVEDKDDREMRQMDFVFVDIDTGLVNPAPFPMSPGMELEEWRYENAVLFCARLGWPRKLCTNLIRAFRDAIRQQPGAAADNKVEMVMLHWYADLFGHYRFTGAHQDWNAASRRLLIDWQPERSYRPYLEYLTETTMFEEWMKGRIADIACPPVRDPEEPSTSKAGTGAETPEGSEDDLNEKMDKIWIDSFNSLTPRPISKIVTKVAYMFSGLRKTSN